ncbi:MAG: CPBP family intramembrane metalloprotease [Ruminococcus sp.]|nr:CPBP family intramembrane metalloprotease [Ruminococcus sp.]
MENYTQTNIQQPAPPPPPPRALTPEDAERKSFKGKVEYMGGGLLIYTCIIYGIYIADMFAHFIYFAIKTMGDKAEYNRLITEYNDTLLERAGGMIAGVIVGAVFMILFFIKALPLKKIFASHRKMTFPKLLMLISVLMCCQLPFMFFDEGVEWLLNQVGLSLQQAIESSQAGSTTISMFLYASFIGPIVEELIYRGFVMHTFERVGCGKFCAILSSAILFGIMHANPTQSIFAIYVGVIFGYAAMEFGLGWSIALHIINNFLFGDVLTFIANKLPETAGAILEYSVLGVMFLAGLIVFIVKRKHAVSYIRENNPPAKHYGWIFSCITILAFIVMNLFFALLSFRKFEG